ncbi:hypothetical protein NP493_167g04065 [Ridgeia piscesae]|uniref:Uncharacterized protein n=1 Tax=Ridgeia piscesae TaxID=27915 RepID=A0AAD9P3B0_RIDPI|nr:hypothetical protein NP493_167g04065 [Ridgeia piscesae]
MSHQIATVLSARLMLYTPLVDLPILRRSAQSWAPCPLNSARSRNLKSSLVNSFSCRATVSLSVAHCLCSSWFCFRCCSMVSSSVVISLCCCSTVSLSVVISLCCCSTVCLSVVVALCCCSTVCLSVVVSLCCCSTVCLSVVVSLCCCSNESCCRSTVSWSRSTKGVRASMSLSSS